MKDYQLGPEFELGAKGSLQLEAGGDLYLRCRNAWSELAGDRGHVTVKFQVHEPGEAADEGRACHLSACDSALCGRQWRAAAECQPHR